MALYKVTRPRGIKLHGDMVSCGTILQSEQLGSSRVTATLLRAGWIEPTMEVPTTEPASPPPAAKRGRPRS